MMIRGKLLHSSTPSSLSISQRNDYKMRSTQFIPTRSINQSTYRHHRSKPSTTITMLRNFDLPEVVIFYGMETFVQDGRMEHPKKTSLQPGVSRILQESTETDTCIILLSETYTEHQIQEWLQPQPVYKDILSSSNFHIRSSLDMKDPSMFYGRGHGYAPCPAALMDAIASVEIQPKGFGGSSGFGSKLPVSFDQMKCLSPKKDFGIFRIIGLCTISTISQIFLFFFVVVYESTNIHTFKDPVRSPLPIHSVVFVTGPTSKSRARCSAARLAGMRVMYIEQEGMGTCDADDLVDGVVESLGEEGDWEMITLDDISTPGSFWLNPPNPRDDDGDRVNPEDIVTWFLGERNVLDVKDKNDRGSIESNESVEDELTDDEMADILADLDPL